MGSGSNPLWTTTYYLNAYGQLTSAYIGDGKPRSVTYTNDELGQIIRRDETRPYNAPTAQVGSPHVSRCTRNNTRLLAVIESQPQ